MRMPWDVPLLIGSLEFTVDRSSLEREWHVWAKEIRHKLWTWSVVCLQRSYWAGLVRTPSGYARLVFSVTGFTCVVSISLHPLLTYSQSSKFHITNVNLTHYFFFNQRTAIAVIRSARAKRWDHKPVLQKSALNLFYLTGFRKSSGEWMQQREKRIFKYLPNRSQLCEWRMQV
jgi:hypothetical protein